MAVASPPRADCDGAGVVPSSPRRCAPRPARRVEHAADGDGVPARALALDEGPHVALGHGGLEEDRRRLAIDDQIDELLDGLGPASLAVDTPWTAWTSTP